MGDTFGDTETEPQYNCKASHLNFERQTTSLMLSDL